MRTDSLGDRGNVLGRGAATTAHHIDPTFLGKITHQRCHLGPGLIVATEGIGETGIGVAADVAVGDARKFLDVGTHLGGTEGAVDADGKRFGMTDRIPEGLDSLTRKSAAGGIGDGHRQDHGPTHTTLLKDLFTGKDRRLEIEGVKDGLEQQ